MLKKADEMSKQVMDRRACDNEYLHKDFHGALSGGIAYLQKHYGPQAVCDYLGQFAMQSDREHPPCR